MDKENRVVVLIDMDCFYCQVEEKLNPELKGKPIAVVQYNPWKGGGIIAVNYVARARGVTRHMRGDEAKDKCPEIELPSVPCSRGKADITKYRDAGKDVAKVLQKFTPLLERASIDEAYLDITGPVEERLKRVNINTINADMMPNTYALGYESVDEFLADIHCGGMDNLDFDYEHATRLLVGAIIVSEIRAAVYEETGYRCSAGISHNKILAKLVCGMNKPNKQTVLPKHSINILYETLPLKKVKHLGGKFGDAVCEILRINKMGDLQTFTEKELQLKFDEKNGTWLYNIARGIDLEPVQARFNPKSIGCCKQFRGKAALLDLESLKKWLKDLGDEIEDRLENDALENNRTPKQMVVSFSTQLNDGRDLSSSRSYNFAIEDELCGHLFSSKALELLLESAEGVKPKEGENNRKLKAPIKFLGISVGKFEDNTDAKKTKKIKDYFNAGSSRDATDKEKTNKITIKEDPDKKGNKRIGKEYILQKFFKTTEKTNGNDIPRVQKQDEDQKFKPNTDVLLSDLDTQESFFAKLLNKKTDPDVQSAEFESSIGAKTDSKDKPSTPVCDVIGCGDESNESDYSASTINLEINKSIALFEEDPQDIERVSNMRQLLNTSTLLENHNEPLIETEATEQPNNEIQETKESNTKDTFDCSECGKTIPVTKFEMHADYHLALRLREEDRQEIRKIKEKTNQNTLPEVKKRGKPPEEHNKNETVASIKNFFVKLDETIPTEVCSECGKKVPLKIFAEHLDFHEAQKLSRELNKKSPVSINSNVKRKRKSASPIKKQKIPKCKSIDTFFK